MKIDKAAILIKKAALEFDRMSNSLLGEYGLTTSQYKIMKYLYEHADEGVRLVDLEKYYSISHPTAIGIVVNLEKKGLVTYQNNPRHGRSRYIIPTKEALERKEELEALGDQLEAELTRQLSEKERKQLIALLQKMIGLKDEE